MIDFIKIQGNDDYLYDCLYNNIELEYFRYDNFMEFWQYKKHSKSIILCFNIHSKSRFEIRFKPHYFFNDDKHNANDFTPVECTQSIKKIIDVLDLNNHTDKLKVVNIEYGINFTAPVDTKALLDSLAYNERNLFLNSTELRYSKESYKTGYTGKANSYKIIKAYCKGIQQPEFTDKNTFRFEVKSKQSKFINKLGIYYLNDLLNIDIYENLKTSLLLETKNLLILYPEVNQSRLTDNEKERLTKYFNAHCWKIVINDNSRNLFARKKSDYNKLLDKIGYNIHKEYYNAIEAKLNNLFECVHIPHANKNKVCAYSNINTSGNCTHYII